MNGPAPTGWLAKPAPCWWIAVGDPTNGIKVTAEGNTAFLAFNVILRVTASRTSMAWMRLACVARDALFFGSWSRSQLNRTEAESYGVPSVNLMFGRSFRVHTSASVDVNELAV